MLYVYGMDVSPEVIYIIRHAEKPLKPSLSGVDYAGSPNEHSLLPRGWQRSGALAALFHPDFGPLRPGLKTPSVLVAPSFGHPGKTAAHRSYQTIQGLGEHLELAIMCQFPEGQEQQLADSLVRKSEAGTLCQGSTRVRDSARLVGGRVLDKTLKKCERAQLVRLPRSLTMGNATDAFQKWKGSPRGPVRN